MYKPVFSMALSITWHYRTFSRLMRAIIERLNPRVASIPTTWGGPAYTWRASNIYKATPYFAQLGRAAVVKVSQRLWGRSLLAPRHTEYAIVAAARRAVLEEVALSRTTMRSAILFKEHALGDFLTHTRTSNPAYAEALGRMITAEMILRMTELE
jgi:hypothetical protein